MQAPGPGTLKFVHGLKTRGMLECVGNLWREHGDVFRLKVTDWFSREQLRHVGVAAGAEPRRGAV